MEHMFLVGRGISHSLSPPMWNHLLARLGRPDRYGLRDVDEADLPSVLAEIRSAAVTAANVTMPYKAWAARAADDATPEVTATDAANFLQLRNGRLFADNTDVVGARRLLARVPAPGRVVMMGAGGTASSLLRALEGRTEHVTVVNRSIERGEHLAALHAARFERLIVAPWDRRDAVAEDADLLVNTVPLVDEPPLRLPGEGSGMRIYDAIYRRRPTELQRLAAERGMPLCDGLTHLAAQAIAMLGHLGLDDEHGALLVEGLEGATGRPVLAWGRPLASSPTETVWLVGMMGAGKSTVGRSLSSRLDREFVDVDDVVVAEAGASIPEIFAREGEEGFRRREHAAIARLAGRRAVVATGGGAVLRPENVDLMRASGAVAWLDAPPHVLATRIGDGRSRPLVTGSDPATALGVLLTEREDRYRAAAHRAFDAGGRPSEVVEELVQWIGS